MKVTKKAKKPAIQMNHYALCSGRNPEAVKQHRDKAQYHSMMAVFHTLCQDDQLVFMAMFNQLVENNDRKTNKL